MSSSPWLWKKMGGRGEGREGGMGIEGERKGGWGKDGEKERRRRRRGEEGEREGEGERKGKEGRGGRKIFNAGQRHPCT